MKLEDRVKPKILNSQIIHKVNDYHAQMINVSRLCSMLLAGQDVYYLEAKPAGYILAANEAEKNANITLVECRTFGAVGRLYLSGKESDVARAAGTARVRYTEFNRIRESLLAEKNNIEDAVEIKPFCNELLKAFKALFV